MTTPRLLAGALQRRVAATSSHVLPLRAFSSSARTLKQRRAAPPPDPHGPAALNALLSRLSISPSADLHPQLMACLTHPSFVQDVEGLTPVEAKSEGESSSETNPAESSDAAAATAAETNELLSSLGNTLLGLFASEHLATRYPHLPSTALSAAVTAYVGPSSLVSVGRELGLGVTRDAGRASGRANAAVGMPIRWKRVVPADIPPVDTPVAPGFREQAKRLSERRNATWEEGVASVVRAFVGLVYQEEGIHAARDFVTAHFLTRHVDMSAIFNFRKPKHVLSQVVSKHLADAGVPASQQTGVIESRVIASSGVNSQAPLFNIGLFLSNGLKLAEGHGSSLAMAEHRAATNALLSLFLVRSDAGGAAPVTLPTAAHAARPIAKGQIGVAGGEAFIPSGAYGASESLVGLGRGIARRA